MKSESLAVKYRPRTLEGLIGQDHIQNQIRGMFKAKRVNPTMMLFGPTGLGKTTTARLLAQMLNCEDLDKKTLQPCGKCRNCQYKPENHPDVHEINMANETGVDNARTMIKQASGMPTMGNFRIFILDEFHKATPAAQECFPPDAEVVMHDGSFKEIQYVQEGDIVQSFDTVSQLYQAQEVEATRVISNSKPMVRVEIEGIGFERCTEDHKWWSLDRNCMVEAKYLRPGERIVISDT